MSSPFTRMFPDETPRQDTAQPAGKWARMFPDEREAQAGRLEALSRNPLASPAEVGEAAQLGRSLALPTDVVARNLATVRPLSVQRGPDWLRFIDDAPKTARWLDNPVNHSLAVDDAENLGFLERLSRSRFVQEFGGGMAGPTSPALKAPTPIERGILTAEWQRGQLQVERGRLGALSSAERQRPEVQDRISEIDATLAQPLPEAEGFARFVRGTTAILPGMLGGAVEGGAGAMVGAVVGGTIGALATGGAGTLAGASAGAKVGAMFGAVQETSAQIGGNLTLDLESKGVDATTADLAGRTAGWLGGGVEFSNVGLVLKPFGRFLGVGAASALTKPTVRAAMANAGKYYAGTIGTETLEENVQQGISLAAEEIAGRVSGVETGVTGDRVWDEIQSTTVETLVAMALLPIPGTALVGVEGLAQVQAANQRVAGLTAAIDRAKKSTTRSRDPEAFREVVKEQTDGQVVYLDAERASILLQDNDVTPEQFVELAGITMQDWTQAVEATGSELAIPVDALLTNLAELPLAEGMLADLRFEVGGMTQREANAVLKDMAGFRDRVAQEAEAVGEIGESDPAWRIVEDLREKLGATGKYTPEQVMLQAQTAAKPYAVWARAIASQNPDNPMADPWTLYSRKGGLGVIGGARAEAVFDAEMAVARARRQGRTAEEVEALRGRVTKLVDERVAIRAVLEESEQTLDVRDEAGRLRQNLRNVSTDALVAEYVRLRDIAMFAEAELQDIQAAFSLAESESGAVVTDEEVAGRVEESGFSGKVQGFEDAETWTGKRVAYDRHLRALRNQARKVERSVPRIGVELAARGIENPDAYLVENGLESLVGRAQVDAPFQSPLTQAELTISDAAEAREFQAFGYSMKEIADELGTNVDRVKALLKLPPVPVPDELRLRLAFNGVEMLMQAAFHGTPYTFDGEVEIVRADGRVETYQLGGRFPAEVEAEIAAGTARAKEYPAGRFRLGKIGTGEGAQAYGWGLYFAENEGVATGYRETLSRHLRDNRAIAKRVAPSDWSYQITSELALLAGDEQVWPSAKDAAMQLFARSAELREKFRDKKTAEAVAYLTPIVQKTRESIQAESGSLYRVDIPDQAVAKMLDWDTNLGNQARGAEGLVNAVVHNLPDEVFNSRSQMEEALAILELDANDNPNGLSFRDLADELLESGRGREVFARASVRLDAAGDEIYRALSNTLNSDEAASKALLAAGIPGIKYLDAGSRGRTRWEVVAPEGGVNEFPDEASARAFQARNPTYTIRAPETTRNLVVFDDALVTITHRNGEPVTAQERTDFLAQEGMQPQNPWQPFREYKGDGGKRYADYALGGDRNKGLLTVELDKKKGWRVRNVFVDASEARNGNAVAGYRAINSESIAATGKPLRSSNIGYAKKGDATTLSPDGVALWESLVRSGEAEKVGNSYQFVVAAQTEPLGDTIDVDGVSRPTTNSTGQPIHPTAEGVRNFWRWFAGSRVVDEQGRPLVVYHGTTATDITEFLPDGGRNDSGILEMFRKAKSENTDFGYMGFRAGTFFSPDPDYAGNYTGENRGVLYPAYIKAESPVFVDQRIRGNPARGTGGKTPDALIMYDGANGDAINEVAVIDPTQVKSAIGNDGAFGPTANILRQGGNRPNAYYLRANRVIGLMQGTNRSSFLHEMSHDYLATLESVATDPDAPAWLVQDFETAMKAVGVADDDRVAFVQYLRSGKGRTDKETRAFEQAEEKWARSFESYLETGEAPSRDLLRAFANFRVWLGQVYRKIRSLLVPVSPELRGVFDRMLATDEEIAEYRQSPEAKPLFLERPEGMTDAQWAEYTKGFQTRDAVLGGALMKRVMVEQLAAVNADWANKRAEVEAAVREELAMDPTVQAVEFLRNGVDGQPMKLNRALLNAIAPDLWKSLPKGTTSPDGEMTLDAVALQFKFPDEAALTAALQRYVEVDAVVAQRVAATFKREYGDLLGDSTAMAEAVAEVTHRSESADPVVRELKALGRQLGIRVVDKPALVQVAKDMIGGMRVSDILPYKYELAEAKEARLAEQALRKGDVAKAAFHKRRQLLNNILTKEALSAVAESEKVRTFAVRMSGESAQAVLGKAGQSFADAMNAILGDYEFARVPRKQIARRAALDAYVKAVTDEGGVPMLAQDVVEDARIVNYRALTMDELRGVEAAMRQIYHHAKTVDTLAKEGRKVSLAQAEESVVASLAKHRPEVEMNVDGTPLSLAASYERARAIDAWHVPPTFLFRWLDGDNYGETWQAFYAPIKAAEDAELTRMKEASARVTEIENMVEVPPYLLDVGKRYDGIRSKLTRRQVLALAMNWGNASSREAVLEARTGDGKPQFGSAASIERMFAEALSAEDWAYVQARWDYANTFWPEIADLERRTNGITPEKIEASPFTIQTKDGSVIEVKGGYYPLAYDRSLGLGKGSLQAGKNLFETDAGSLMSVGGARAQTQHGWSNERVGSRYQPINLSLGVWNRHIQSVIHDLTHREAVRDVYALWRREGVREAMVRAAGQPYYDAVKAWLVRVANPNAVIGDTSFIEKASALARVGTTAVNLGFKFSTGIAQTLGYLQSVEAIGPKWMAVGLKELGAGTVTSWANLENSKAVRFVMESSPMMANRRFNYNRDVADYARSNFGKLTNVDAFNFWFIGAMDGMVSVPTWIGAYRKAMASNGNDHAASVQYADDTVESTQGAGSAKDLSRIQGGPELRKLMTMHYTAFSRMYGQWRRAFGNVQTGKYGMARFAAAMTLLWFGQVVLAELMTGRGNDDEDSDVEFWAMKMLKFPASFIVGVRDVVNAVGPDAYGYKMTPAEAAFERTAKAVNVVYRETLGDLFHGADRELTEPEARALIEAPGYWLRLPSKAVWQYGDYLMDWAQGEVNPTNPAAAAAGLLLNRR